MMGPSCIPVDETTTETLHIMLENTKSQWQEETLEHQNYFTYNQTKEKLVPFETLQTSIQIHHSYENVYIPSKLSLYNLLKNNGSETERAKKCKLGNHTPDIYANNNNEI